MVQKLQFREVFQKNAANYFQKDFGHLNHYQLSKALGFSYISEILDFQNPDIFPTEWDQLEDYITDGANDNGSDLIYSQDSTHHIFQFKYRKKNDIENHHEVETFKDIVWKRLHPKNAFAKNSQLEEAVSRINFKEDIFNLYYITLGRKNEIISKISESPIEDVDDDYLKDLSDRCFFKFIDEDTLNESMRVKNNRPEMGIDVDISFSPNGDRSWLKYESEGRKSYIGTLSTSQIKKIWSDKNNQDNLFNLNIRMHLGDNATNKNIKKTALDDYENFFFYNNGISAVAQKIVEKDGNSLNCRNFSIINGAQTFKSLALVHDKGLQSNGNSYKNLEIMIRLTEISDLMKTSNSENFIDKVTRYNNTQNVVKNYDFRSNDLVQRSLVKHFEHVKSKNGKKYFYKNKRSNQRKSDRIIIKMDVFCKVIHSFVVGPIDFYGGMVDLFDLNKGYLNLFGNKETGEIEDYVSEEKFKLYSSIYFLWEYFSEKFRIEKKNKIEEFAKNEVNQKNSISPSKPLQGSGELSFYLVKKVFEIVLEKEDTDFEQEFVKNFKDPNWDNNQKKRELIDDMLLFVTDEVISYYHASTNFPEFVHRNWFRDKATLKTLETNIANKNFNIKMIKDKISDL